MAESSEDSLQFTSEGPNIEQKVNILTLSLNGFEKVREKREVNQTAWQGACPIVRLRKSKVLNESVVPQSGRRTLCRMQFSFDPG